MLHNILTETLCTQPSLSKKKRQKNLCEDGFAIVLGAGQACVEVTGLLGRLRWVVRYEVTQ